MNVIWATFRKEVSEVLRDKRTLLLTILVPMVFYPALVMLVGKLGDKQLKKEQARELNVAVFISGDGLGFVDEYKKLEEFDKGINWHLNDSQTAEVLMKSGEYDLFAELHFTSDQENKLPYWKVKIHYFSTARGESDLKRVKASFKKLKMNIVEQKLGKVIDIEKPKDHASVRESAGSKFGGMAAYFIVFLAFTGCMAVAVDVAAGEKERGTLEAMLVTPASFWEITFGKLLFVVTMGLLSVASTAIGIGSMVLAVGSAIEGMSLGGVGWVSILGIVFLIFVMVFFFAVLLFAMSILARSSKEAHMRGSLLMLFIAMALVYCTLPGVASTGNILFIPVLNVALALRALWEGSMTLIDYLVVVGSLVLLSALIVWYINRKVSNDAERMLLK